MNKYLQKHALFPPQIAIPPLTNLGIVVVIPCYDEPDLISSLQALKNCDLPACAVEVIVVVNSSEKADEAAKLQNLKTIATANLWISKNKQATLHFHLLHHPTLPKKHAGVGLARKIGMDEAVYRLEQVGHSEGIIACFDADSLCAANYFVELQNNFKKHPQTPACSIYFEHPTQGNDFSPKLYASIIQYELYLRYYVHALRFAGFPYAFQTIGSSMAVRCSAYQQQGGMNRRKAGEDFYFIHKFTPSPHFTELNSTTVIPSPRPSHRVPFGTGKAVQELINSDQKGQIYSAYHPQCFRDLKELMNVVDDLFFIKTDEQIAAFLKKMPDSVAQFLKSQHFSKKLIEIHQHTNHLSSFKKRFFAWMDAFRVLKYVHFARDHFYKNVAVVEAVRFLMGNDISPTEQTPQELLSYFRQLDSGK